jgi:signal peptidase II
MSDVTDPPAGGESSEAADAAGNAEAASAPSPEPAAEAPLSDAASVPAPGEPSPDASAAPAPALLPVPDGAPPTPVEAPPPTSEELAQLSARPSFVFFGVVAALSLVADIGSKAWAEVVLSRRTSLEPSIEVIKGHLGFTLAYNRGGAWGLLHDASENIRRPFFLIVSVAAIAFIVSLYSRLAPTQRALKWGLPLVLGGALGNLSDRITRSSVVDFIDYHAAWIEKMNGFIARYSKGWTVTEHWPTFNVADIFICVGVGLMAVDMVTSRRKPASSQSPPPGAPPAPEAPPPVPAPTASAGASAPSEEPKLSPEVAADPAAPGAG